jgi:signal transduction histidine kinase/ActR/RegA family two-component response regulator
MRGRDGREVWFRDQRRLIPEADGGPIVHGVMVDITARKNAETALRQKEEQLRHSQKMEALGGLAGGIAHDFNNLLTTILGYGHLLLEQKKLDSEGRADLAEIIHAGERAERLTRQLLAFSRKQAIETAPTDINEVVTEMERLLRRTLGEDIELVTVLSDDAGCILAETGQLEQVLMNLAVNARSAMPRGGRLVITTRRVRLDEEFCRMRELLPGEYVLLEVSDTGCGMTPEVRERIFEPFFTTKKDGEGTGLGLATVYGIVRGFGGIIEVDSEVEKGTRFRMYFPHLESHEAPRPGTETSEAPGGTETILLVEDDASVRRLTSRFLASLGYNVLEASNSGEALMIFERPGTRVDLLLTDIVMPHVSGVETATRLRQIWPGLRVLYMTGFARETSALLSEDADAPVIFKPFNRATLARRVRQALDAASAANSSTSEA